jgi:hypothetical protein
MAVVPLFYIREEKSGLVKLSFSLTTILKLVAFRELSYLSKTRTDKP